MNMHADETGIIVATREKYRLSSGSFGSLYPGHWKFFKPSTKHIQIVHLHSWYDRVVDDFSRKISRKYRIKFSHGRKIYSIFSAYVFTTNYSLSA